MSFESMQLCNFVKRNRKKCKAPAMRESDKCKHHGGALARSTRTHGLYAKYQPKRIQDLVEEQLANDKLLDLRQQIALISALLADSMDQTRKRQEKEKRAHFTTEEKQEIAVLSEKMSAAIERYAKVGVVLKYLVHLDTVQKLLEGWSALTRRYIPNESDREEFGKELSNVTAFLIEEDAKNAGGRVGRPLKEVKEYREEEEEEG